MKMTAIRAIAKRMKINSVGMAKTELIRSIQRTEGNFPCFGTAEKDCNQPTCLWREDCVGKAAQKCVGKDTACGTIIKKKIS